jgi:hypothetical protein
MIDTHQRALLQYLADCGERVVTPTESTVAQGYTQLAFDGLVLCAGSTQLCGADCLVFELTDTGRLALYNEVKESPRDGEDE